MNSINIVQITEKSLILDNILKSIDESRKSYDKVCWDRDGFDKTGGFDKDAHDKGCIGHDRS